MRATAVTSLLSHAQHPCRRNRNRGEVAAACRDLIAILRSWRHGGVGSGGLGKRPVLGGAARELRSALEDVGGGLAH